MPVLIYGFKKAEKALGIDIINSHQDVCLVCIVRTPPVLRCRQGNDQIAST